MLTSKRLPSDLPLLIGHKAGTLPAELHQKIAAHAAGETTGCFYTHPCDSDRVKAARSLDQPGVFRNTAPATQLFANFPELSQRITRDQFERHMELEFNEANLIPAEEMLRESAASSLTDAMVRKFYGTVNVSLRPLITGDACPPLGAEALSADWRAACQTAENLRPRAEELSKNCLEKQRRKTDLFTALYLSGAHFKLEAGAFGLPAGATSVAEQEAAARAEVETASAAITERLAGLEPFMEALRRRVMVALAQPQNRSSAPPTGEIKDVSALIPLLAAVSSQMPRIHDMSSKLQAFGALADNRGNHPEPTEVDNVIAGLARDFTSHVSAIQESLKSFAYPFPQARGQLTVAEYARTEDAHKHEWVRAYQEASTHAERLFTLNYRLIGQVLIAANAAEESLSACRSDALTTDTVSV